MIQTPTQSKHLTFFTYIQTHIKHTRTHTRTYVIHTHILISSELWIIREHLMVTERFTNAHTHMYIYIYDNRHHIHIHIYTHSHFAYLLSIRTSALQHNENKFNMYACVLACYTCIYFGWNISIHTTKQGSAQYFLATSSAAKEP